MKVIFLFQFLFFFFNVHQIKREGSLEMMIGHPFAIPLEMEAPMALLEALYFQGGRVEKSCEDPDLQMLSVINAH